MERPERQTGGICEQSVLARRCCGCLTILMEIEMMNIGRKNKGCENVPYFGFEEGRSATEIAIALRLMAAAAKDWFGELGIIARSMGMCSRLSAMFLLEAWLWRWRKWTLHQCCRVQQRGNRLEADMTSSSENKSEWNTLWQINQTRRERDPTWQWGVSCKLQQERWNNEKVWVTMKINHGQNEECRVSPWSCADNCYVFAASRQEIRW